MFSGRGKPILSTERLWLRLPRSGDFAEWAKLRRSSKDFLEKWEPTWKPDHLASSSFANRVSQAKKSYDAGTSLSLLLVRHADNAIVGGITLDNIRAGPSQSGSLGYWVGEIHARQGYMQETIPAMVHYAFHDLDLSRIEAACLPTNVPSRRLLEKTGFKYEGVAQSYLEIAGRWCNHVLYANLRGDRRGSADTL